MEKRVKFGKLQVVDSVHTIANVSLIKDERKKQEGKPPRDADACWGAKGNKLVAGKDGKKHKEAEYLYGYKDQDRGFVRHAIQSYLTFVVLNLKRLVKLLTGVSFRGDPGAYASGS